MSFTIAGEKDVIKSSEENLYKVLPWIYYNYGKQDNIRLTKLWTELTTREYLSKRNTWRTEITSEKRKMLDDYTGKKLSEPKKLKRSDIHYQRRQIILNYYPPFLAALDKLYKNLNEGNEQKAKNLSNKIEKEWDVFISYSRSNKRTPSIRYRQKRNDSCVDEINLVRLKSFKIDKQNSNTFVEKLDDIYPNIVVQIDPFAPMEQILTQIGEIIDDYNIDITHLNSKSYSKQKFQERINSPFLKDRIARKLDNKKTYDLSSWYENYNDIRTKPQDLTVIKMFTQNKPLGDIESSISSFYKSDKVRIQRVTDRLKTIIEYCEMYKKNKSSFYKKCKKMTNKSSITLNDLKA